MFRQRYSFDKTDDDKTSLSAPYRSEKVDSAPRQRQQPLPTEYDSSSPALLSRHSDHDDSHKSSLSVPIRSVVAQRLPKSDDCRKLSPNQQPKIHYSTDNKTDKRIFRKKDGGALDLALQEKKQSSDGNRGIEKLAPFAAGHDSGQNASLSSFSAFDHQWSSVEAGTSEFCGADQKETPVPTFTHKTETSRANSLRRSRQHQGKQAVPGAYRVRGLNHTSSSVSITDDLVDVTLPTNTITDMPVPIPLRAEIVDDDKEYKQLEQDMLKGAVLADVVAPSHNRRRWVMRGCMLATAVIAVVVVVVVVLARRHKRAVSNGAVTLDSNSLFPRDINNNNPSATIAQLVDTAANHTILAGF